MENDFLPLSKKLRRNTISDIMQIITTAAFKAREVKRELNQSYLILKKNINFLQLFKCTGLWPTLYDIIYYLYILHYQQIHKSNFRPCNFFDADAKIIEILDSAFWTLDLTCTFGIIP